MVNVMLLFVSRFVTLIGSPLLGLLVVRYLGPDTYGEYAAALAVTGLFGFLCDFGVQQTVLRFGANLRLLAPVLKRGSLVSLLYTGIAVVLILFWTSFFSYSPLVRRIVVIQCAGLLRIPLLTLVTAGLQLRGEYGRIALWNVSSTLVQWVGTLSVMAAGWSVLFLVAVPISISLIVSVAMVVIEGRRLGVYYQSGLSPATSIFLWESWKFGTAGTMYQIYQKSDSAILSATRESIEIGHYSVAMRMAELANAVPGIVFNQVLFPKYFRWSQNDRARLTSFYRLSTKCMLILGGQVAAFLVLFGSDLIRLLFNMDDSVFSFIVPALAIGVMLHFWAAAPGAVLTTDGHVTRKIWIQGLVALTSLLLNVTFTPYYGARAAAGIFVLVQLLLAVLYTREVTCRVGFQVFDSKLEVAIFTMSGVGLLLVAWWLVGMSWMVRGLGLVAIILVSTALTFLKWLTPAERRVVAGLVPLNRLLNRWPRR